MRAIEFERRTICNYGTDAEPDMREMVWRDRMPYSQSVVEYAQKYAHNGAYTIIDIPDTRPLHEIKSELIAKSKADLAAYLESNPIQWTDGQYYSITAEKQAQLTGKIMAATMAQTMSQPYTLTWNSTGDVCREWTLADLSALAFAIDKRVTALVTYQQEKEIEIRNAKTQEELNAIEVNYDAVG